MTASSASTTLDLASGSGGAADNAAVGDDVFERRLVADAAGGCDESFRILVERHQNQVFRLCTRLLGCREDAREATQDTFVRAYDALPRFKPQARLFTWLYQIAVNRCRDQVRARAAKKRSQPARTGGGSCATEQLPGAGATCPEPDPAERLTLSEDLAKLERGLAALPPVIREALVLAAIEGLSFKECAEVLGCSTRAVEGRVYRARQELVAWWDSTES